MRMNKSVSQEEVLGEVEVEVEAAFTCCCVELVRAFGVMPRLPSDSQNRRRVVNGGTGNRELTMRLKFRRSRRSTWYATMNQGVRAQR